MNWITNYVRPKIRALVQKQDVPDNLWDKCPSCAQMIFHRELETNYNVCPHCGHHLRIAATKRLEQVFDDSRYSRIELPEVVTDPLRFRDRKRYSERLKEARAKSGEQDAIIVAHGKIAGQKTVVAVFNFAFMGGSMGVAVGEGLLAAARLAVLQEAPLLVIPSSGGARMQEGILSLMQLPRTTIAVDMVKEAGLPYVVLLADPTTGGVTASFAMLGDIHLAEPGAVIGFAGQRVIEETIREKLPEGFQRAEYLLDHGMVDMVVDRRELRVTLARLFSLLMDRTPSADVVSLAPKQKQAGADATAPAATPATPPATPQGGDGHLGAEATPAATCAASKKPVDGENGAGGSATSAASGPAGVRDDGSGGRVDADRDKSGR